MITKRIFKKFFTVWSLIYATVLNSAEVQISDNYILRTPSGGYMYQVGLLTAGSRIEIPDNYVVKGNDQKVDIERSLMSWVKASKDINIADKKSRGATDKEWKRNSFDTKKHYFLPIKVNYSAPGSKVPDNKELWLAMDYLVSKGDFQSGVYEVTADSEAYAVAPAVTYQAIQDILSKNQACQDQRIDNPAADLVQQLKSTLLPALHDVDSKNLQLPNQNDRAALNSTLRDRFEGKKGNDTRKHCYKDYPEFLRFLEQERKNILGDIATIKTEHLLRLIYRESIGECFAIGQDQTGGDKFKQSTGLFQVNGETCEGFTRRLFKENVCSICDSSQRSQIQRASFSDLSNGPNCRENPYFNTILALHTLKEKFSVFGNQSKEAIRPPNYHCVEGTPCKFPASVKLDFGSLSPENQTRWALAAYNGPSKWVERAVFDLETFNQNTGSNLDYHNWDDLRLFFLKRHLTYGQEEQWFGGQHGRDERYSISNLSYVESIYGR